MFGKRIVVISVLALALICAIGATVEWTGASPAAGPSQIGTAFTYQGQLLSSGAPVSGTCDFQFSLWDAVGSGTPPTGGNQVGSTQSAPSIPVSNGLFAVQLDFGSGIFTGEARWLQTAVRCPAGSGTYTTLAPRQALNPVPYALLSQDLSLPFDKWINSADNAFSVGNHGAGNAGTFTADGSSGAVAAWSYGSGQALNVEVRGTGKAAHFRIDNPDNTGHLIDASTNGLGSGASFRISNTLNTHSALAADTIGSGNAGSFNTSGAGNAVSAWSTGSGRALHAEVRGTGDVAFLKIDNPNNSSNLINASTNGLGSGASFRINNTLNNQAALDAYTNGTDNAGKFTTSGAGNAVSAWATGSGRALNAVNTGTGGVAFLRIDNPNNADAVINASTYGIGGVAGFGINNPLNTVPALHVGTNGSGQAVNIQSTGSGGAIVASTTGSDWVATFSANGQSGKGVFISTPAGNQGLNVAGGSKNAVVATSLGARLLYTEESSAVWFTDYGFGRLTDGSVFITIAPLFAETVNLDEPYHVFVQAYGDAELYVSQRTSLGFEVRLRAGDPNVEFSYRLVATRRGYEGKRLEHATWADDDPNLYPAQPAAPQNGDAR
jgi:hypothetical protein